MRDMAIRLKNSDATFSPAMLIPMIETYAVEFQYNVGPRNWVPDLFIHVQFPYETILATLQGMFANNLPPFINRNRVILANHMVYLCEQWYSECIRANQRLYDSEENAAAIDELLQTLLGEGLQGDDRQQAENLRRKIARSFRW